MGDWSQTERSIGIDTPLGDDVLILLAVKSEEAISELYNLQLELASERIDITPKEVIGKPVDIWIKLGDGNKRFINGYISRFALGPMKTDGYRNYRAEVVPWLWFHNKNKDFRIFQNQSVLEVIETLFNKSKIANFKFDTQKQYPKLDYCVQYRESDMAFLSRLAEHHGLFFFFTHEQGQHSLVIADQTTAYPECAEHNVTQTLGGHVGDHIRSWDRQYEYVTSQWSQTDFDFESPSTNLETTSKTVLDLTTATQIERFDYPGGYSKTSDGQELTDLHMMEDEAHYDVVNAESSYRSFFAGGKFTIKHHDFEQEKGQSYVITRLSFEARDDTYSTAASGQAYYNNSFDAIPDSMLYLRNVQQEKPIIQGPQTAIVVGPEGEKIYTDKYGRIKVKFHWDRHGKRNESSSCWVRVSQNWAGKQWGEVSMPHVGNEVIVSFLEGDPDKPIVTGRVYNAENVPPQTLPSNDEKRIIRDDAGNEIVMDATPGQEQIRIASPGSSALVLGKSGSSSSNNSANQKNAKVHGADDYEGEINKKNWDVFAVNFGDEFKAGAGNNFEFTAGSDLELRGGTKAEIYMGADLEAKFAMSTAFQLGPQYEMTIGPKFEKHIGPSEEFASGPIVNKTEEDILSRAKKDHIIAAGDQLCFVANCENDKGDSRSIINAEGDEIIFSIGEDPKPAKNKTTLTLANAKPQKQTTPMEWYKKMSESSADSSIQVILFVGALLESILALAAQATSTIGMGVAGTSINLEDENQKQALMDQKKNIMITSTAVSVAMLTLMGILNVLAWIFSANANKDAAIEPIKHTTKDPDASINISKKNGIEIRAVKKPAVKLVSGESNKDDENAMLQLLNNKAKLSIKNSKIWMAKETGTISLDNTASSKGQIQLLAKGDILLKSEKRVAIKSDAFFKGEINSKNFKVLSN